MAFVAGVFGTGGPAKTATCGRLRKSTTRAAEWSSDGSGQGAGAGSSGGNLETIEFIIRSDGRVEQKVMNVKGSKCVEITRELEEKLGEVVHDEKTSEYFEESQPEKVYEEVTEDLPTW